VRILRIRIGTLQLGMLKPAEWRYLNSTEVAALKQDRPGLPAYPDMTSRKKAVTGYKRPARGGFARSTEGRERSETDRKPSIRKGPTKPPDRHEKPAIGRKPPARKPR
jgi:hypothetical protein